MPINQLVTSVKKNIHFISLFFFEKPIICLSLWKFFEILDNA